MKDVYLIMKVGCEGIEELNYLTDDSKDAKKKLRKLRKEMMDEKRKTKAEDRKKGELLDRRFYEFIYNTDLYCVQKWDGKEFKCACQDLGFKTKRGELILY